jgi:hypothetical protein|tara:strand:+ start:392 stop:568 length:177 start_codon:yes stop_codon:yes gene_type:complete
MVIENAKYQFIQGTTVNGVINAVIDGVQMSIPIDLANRHYAEIKAQVDAGTLTIEEAD